MPYLETVEELAEALADACGVYNQRLILLPHEQGHADECGCRMCWCGRIELRIRAAVAHEQRLKASDLLARRRQALHPETTGWDASDAQEAP